ncbi:MAG: amidohydrolase [Myxococcota bacterium]
MFDSIRRNPSTTASAGEPTTSTARASTLRCDDVSPDDTFDHGSGHTLCNCTGPAFKRPISSWPEAPLASAAMAGADAAFAAPVPVAEIKALIEPRLPALFEQYKHFHQNPELAGQEVKTREIVGKRLRELGYEVTENFGKWSDGKELQSAVAILKNGEGPTLLVRADMDALPITEKTNVPYASTKRATQPDGTEVGVMHACGHDVHTTNLLGFADIMMQLKDRWSGTLMLIAQPAEEAMSGAKAMMESGLYESFGKPDAAIALHCYGPATPNVIATRAGAMMASVDSLDVVLHGRGGHGSTPQATVDPVAMAGNFIGQTHDIVSRKVTPGEPALITIGQIRAGTARNIIPDSAELKLTVRSFADPVQKVLVDNITNVAKGVAVAVGAPKEPTVTKAEPTYPAVINDAALHTRLTTVWQQQLAGEKITIREMPRIMAGEDFPRFGKDDRSIPTLFFFVGASTQAELDRRQAAGLPPPVSHTNDFLPDAVNTMRTGLLAFTTAATSFLQKK